jgi:hypothetical protein
MRKGALCVGGVCLGLALVIVGMTAGGGDDTCKILSRYGNETASEVLVGGPPPVHLIASSVAVPADRGLQAPKVFDEFAAAGWRLTYGNRYWQLPGKPVRPAHSMGAVLRSAGTATLRIDQWPDGRVDIIYLRPATFLDRAKRTFTNLFRLP